MPIDPSIDFPNFADDWLTLPLENFGTAEHGGNNNMTVDQGFGGIGPTVGNQDMLEIITNQRYMNQQWNGYTAPTHFMPGAGYQQ